MKFQPMETAPKDGMIIEVRVGRNKYRTRWLRPREIWIDWERQHVELNPPNGWRPWPVQFRQWTAEEEEVLALIHRP